MSFGEKMSNKVLVTGGSGFIGSALVKRLKDKGYIVAVFDATQGQDIRNVKEVAREIQGQDAVFHLAAVADLNWARVHPLETMAINVKGTWNVAYACCNNNAKLYYASTCCIYGNQNHHPVDENALPNPAEIYACTKLAGESAIKGFHFTYGLKYNCMRFATIYGEGTRCALGTHIFMGQALRGEPITVHGDGTQTRTLTYISDLVDAMVALLESGKMNSEWNMTTTKEVSALQMAQDIKELTKSQSPIVFIPQRVGQTFRESISNAKMQKEVGWQPKVTWQEGIRRMYKWYLDNNEITKRCGV